MGIRDLIEHFAKVPLGNSAARADSLGQSYEYLIKKFADAPNKKAGEFYTPRSVVNQMVRILYPHEGATIDDPACGTCGMPHGARFRMGAEGKIRQKLLGMDIPDAVIGLGQNLFYGTGLAACILVFRQKKPPKHRKKVLIVDASKEFKKGRAQNELLAEHVDRICRWYKAHDDVEGVARLVPLDEIKENDWNLNIPRYIEPVIEEETITVSEAIENLKKSLNDAYAAEDRLKRLLTEHNLLSCEPQSSQRTQR